jgi:hypothetical protein
MSWRVKIARFFGLDGDQTRPDGVKPWPMDVDPIEELERLINAAQDRDAQDERRFDNLARNEQLNRTAGNRAKVRPIVRPARDVDKKL